MGTKIAKWTRGCYLAPDRGKLQRTVA